MACGAEFPRRGSLNLAGCGKLSTLRRRAPMAGPAGPAGSGSLFQFGVFELDLRAGELRKRGIRVKLQDQPLQILALLIENPGEVVTREQIQHKLWHADTFVDFDNGINGAV